MPRTQFDELAAQCLQRSEIALHQGGQGRAGAGHPAGREARPEHRMVPVLRRVLEDPLLQPVAFAPRSLDQRFKRQARPGRIGDQFVELVDIGPVVAAVVHAQRGFGHVGLKGIGFERQTGEGEHGVLSLRATIH